MPSIVSHAWIPIKKEAAADFLKDFNKDGKVLTTPGLTHAYQGSALNQNEPAHIELIGLYDSMDSVKAAQTAPDHKSAFDALSAVEDTSNPAIKKQHNIFTLNNDFAAVAEAPVVMFTAFVVPAAQQTEFDAAWDEVVKGDKPAGLLLGTHGWGAEEVDAPEIGKGKIFLAAAGWDSTESAEASKAKSTEKAKGLEKFGKPHVRFTTLTKVK